MKALKEKRKIPMKILGMMLALILWISFGETPVYAASGTVYTCVIHPCYSHPVTGVIEDSAGEGNYATGQGMVEGVIYPTGILEVADTGEYYLTIRLSLMDYTANHSFWVQSVGDSGWSEPALGVTGSGTDQNGATNDVCIQVPRENCVIRCGMYVEPMGRDVIFYLYPSDFTEGNNTDMNATMVTSASGTDAAAAQAQQQSSGAGTSSSGSSASQSQNGAAVTPSSSSLPAPSADTSQSSGSNSTAAGQTDTQSTAAGQTDTQSTAASQTDTQTSGTETSGTKNDGTEQTAPSPETEGGNSSETVQKLENSIEAPAAIQSSTAEEAELNEAQGLSLSTAQESEKETEAASDGSVGDQIAVLTISITVSGLLLLGAVAGVVYFFRRNWRRWGGGEDDEE